MSFVTSCATCGACFTGDSCPKCAEATPGPRETAPAIRGYEIAGLMGRGGMGSVYRARQVALDRAVALKILAPQHSRHPEFQSRFEQEAKAMASLSHPNIVSVFDFGIQDGVFFFAMELVEGTNLRERLNERGKLPASEVVPILAQICDALEYAHRSGVVHRDIKPDNILLDREGRARLADFGLAKLSRPGTTTLTKTQLQMGTEWYAAPEQTLDPRNVGPRADLYSLGAVAYEMLTGEPAVGRIEGPSRKVPVPPHVDAAILRALSPEPDRRFAGAAEFREALQRPARARRVSPWIAAIAIVPVAGIAFLLLRRRETPPRPENRPEGPVSNLERASNPIFRAPEKLKLLRTLSGHGKSVAGVAVHPKVRMVLSCGFDFTVRYWDPVKGTESHSFAGHKDVVSMVAFRPDGEQFASTSWDKTIRVWDPKTRREIRIQTGLPDLAPGIAYSPNGELLGAGLKDGSLRFWKSDTGELHAVLTGGHVGWVRCLAFTPDGSLVSAGADGVIVQWRIEERRKVRAMAGHTTHIWDLQVAPDGRWLYSASSDETVRWWDLYEGKETRSVIAHSKGAFSLALSSDGLLLASGGQDGTIKLWDAKTGKELRSWQAHSSLVSDLAFSADDSFLVSASHDLAIKVWGVE